jgi:hypothetical protein
VCSSSYVGGEPGGFLGSFFIPVLMFVEETVAPRPAGQTAVHMAMQVKFPWSSSHHHLNLLLLL